MGCTSSRDANASTGGAPATAHPSSQDQPQTRISTTSASRSALPIPRTSTNHTTTSSDPPVYPPTHPASTTTTRTLRLKPPRPWTSADHPPPLNPSSLTPLTSHNRWTQNLLTRERIAYFDTRVTGSAQVWQTIQLALEMGRDQGDWRGAGSFIEAAGCSVQRGRLEEGVWDERGSFYAVPVWCCSAPVDVIGEGEEEQEEGEKEGDGDVTEADEGEEDAGKLGLVGIQEQDIADEKVAVLRSQEVGKGKGKERSSVPAAKPKDPIKIKARLSDRGTDVVVLVDKEDAVKIVARKLVEEADMPSTTKIRLCYMGKMLSPDFSLPSQGWQPGHVVQALVFG